MSDPGFDRQDGNSELWAQIYGPGGHPALTKMHASYKWLPSSPRCRLCRVPFGSIGGWIMGKRGKAPCKRNPYYCSGCDVFIETFPGGAEVEMSVLYVDVRNSVKTAAEASTSDVAKRINTFLGVASDIITKNDGFIMAFYGDCVVAVWPPGFAGPNHRQKAVTAARKLSQAFDDKSHIPAGTGVHTGPVYICTVEAGEGTFRDVSIFGHVVNVTARLASEAEPGKALASADVLGTSDGTKPLSLKGVEAPVMAATL
ncbi:MAG: adenylate/guanylate cyclase domain-containing protein [Pseudomonadota bacterium]